MPPLLHLLTRIRRWAELGHAASQRLRAVAPTITLLTVAVTVSYSIAHFALGHTAPALACTVALSSLTLNQDVRPRRVAETAVAMILGITLSATILVIAGRGPAQIAATLLAVLSLATLVSRNPAFALSAGTQAMLVAVLPDPGGSPYLRVIDGLIGGFVALTSVAVLPRAPLRRAMRVGESVVHSVADSAHLIALALRSGDATLAQDVLDRLRQLDTPLREWRTTLESAHAIAAISPISRRSRTDWVARLHIQRGLAQVAEELRMVARRAVVLTRGKRPHPRVAHVVSELATGLDQLASAHSRRASQHEPTRHFLAAAASLGEIANSATVDQGIVAMLRQVTMDGLVAAGTSEADARASLPPARVPTTTSPFHLPA